MIAHILTAAAILTGYALFVLVRPLGKCRKCHGTRVTRRGRQARGCPRCKATGRRRRPGATLIHRLAWSVVLGPIMRRRRERKET